MGVKAKRTGRVKTQKKIREDKWNAQFLDLKAYYESKGDFNVKRNENYELEKWIRNQRNAYHKNKLTENRRQKLNEIKFVWEPRRRRMVTKSQGRKSSTRKAPMGSPPPPG